MAPGLPVIATPRPPTPPTIVAPTDGSDLQDSPGDESYPATATTTITTTSHNSHAGSGSSLLHPQSHLLRPLTSTPTFAMSDETVAEGAPLASNPFNFQTQVISTSPVKSNIGQRRGHRYKHSSISAQHQIFQEPPPRPPPVLPASLPVPTVGEAWASMQRDQRARLYWCCCHAAVAMYVFFSAEGSLALTALSHLVFFDVGSAAVCVAVELLGNFEVWRRSSIRHPFGLQRAEVLAGFAMSVFLIFGGFDLLSHEMKHVLESVGGHAPHHPHSHPKAPRVSPGTVDTASLAAIVSTLISAYGLRNHGRIRRVMRVPLPLPFLGQLLPSFADGGMGVVANPFHFLTLCFSSIMLLLPLLSVTNFAWLDGAICAAIAVSMFVLGARLAVAHGLMLLMSYSGRKGGGKPAGASSNSSSSRISPADLGPGGQTKKSDDTRACDDDSNSSSSVSAVVREIEAEPDVARVEEAQFWQVHYGLAMANLKLRVVRGRGGADDADGALSKLRARVARVVNNRLGEGYGRGSSLRWEVTVQMSTDGG